MQRFFFLFFFLFLYAHVYGVIITGDVSDMQSKAAMVDVFIENIRTGSSMMTSADGKFSIAAEADDLIEFRKTGYKVTRVRIPKGNIPSYFKILMQTAPIELPEYELQGWYKDFVKDSLKYRELYKTALEYEKVTGLDVIRHPFSAMSKLNRQRAAFQKEYEQFQREKFIDYTFSEKIVNALTGLHGDSLQYYMRRFRPTYQQLHGMNEYSFYTYIKNSAIFYRTGIRPDYRPAINRSAD